jgi:hypothetical protein
VYNELFERVTATIKLAKTSAAVFSKEDKMPTMGVEQKEKGKLKVILFFSDEHSERVKPVYQETDYT